MCGSTTTGAAPWSITILLVELSWDRPLIAENAQKDGCLKFSSVHRLPDPPVVVADEANEPVNGYDTPLFPIFPAFT